MMNLEAQNIYDNSVFFSAYGTLPRSQHGLSAAPEWPDLQNMVLDTSAFNAEPSKRIIQGQRVLDLGCGYGWFARWARDNGAAFVEAVDISRKMVDRAKQFEADAIANRRNDDSNQSSEIRFKVADIETVIFGDEQQRGSYDLVYSSLTFHYIEDLARLYRKIHSALNKDGKLVFSVEHPICSAPANPGPEWKSVEVDGKERKTWPLNSYCDEGWRVTSWLGVDGVRKYHRTLETYVKLLLESGFTLKALREWAPSMQDVAEHPEWADERHRPYFLLIYAMKM